MSLPLLPAKDQEPMRPGLLGAGLQKNRNTGGKTDLKIAFSCSRIVKPLFTRFMSSRRDRGKSC